DLFLDDVQNLQYICHFGNLLRFLAGAVNPPSAPPCGALPELFIRQESPYISFVSFFTHYVGCNLFRSTFTLLNFQLTTESFYTGEALFINNSRTWISF